MSSNIHNIKNDSGSETDSCFLSKLTYKNRKRLILLSRILHVILLPSLIFSFTGLLKILLITSSFDFALLFCLIWTSIYAIISSFTFFLINYQIRKKAMHLNEQIDRINAEN